MGIISQGYLGGFGPSSDIQNHMTHYDADELARRRRHYKTLVDDKAYSAEYIACEGAVYGEEALAAEALRTMRSDRFTKRDESAQMDKHRMQEQAHYLYARMSQGVVAADLLLCMHAKGEGRFAEHVLLKLEEKERLSLVLAQEKEEKEQKKCSVPSPMEEDIKPSPTKKNKKEKEEAPKKQQKIKPMMMLRCLQ